MGDRESFSSFALAGIGLTAGIRAALRPEMLVGMAVRQVPELEAFGDFYRRLEAQTGADYVAVARERARSSHLLHLPETRLDKVASSFSIYDRSEKATKCLRFHFDKRCINPRFFRAHFVPSFPFGTRQSEGNDWFQG